MSQDSERLEIAYAQHIGEHYRSASDELLHAYQRNKEAGRHHEAGALKAALHHAKLSKHHAFNAHEHLKEVLSIHEKMKVADLRSSAVPAAPGGDLLQ